MRRKIPKETVFPEDWSFQKFLRPDLVEKDNDLSFSLDEIEKFQIIPAGRHWVPVAIFFHAFFKEGNGNHRRALGLRHAQPYLGSVRLFENDFGAGTKVVLALHAFKDKKGNTVIPTMLIRSSMWGKVQEVVLEPMKASGTITDDTLIPLLNI